MPSPLKRVLAKIRLVSAVSPAVTSHAGLLLA
jgi:hypothetical protein